MMARLDAKRISEALVWAAAIFYLYWFFGNPNPAGSGVAIGMLFGAWSVQYRPAPRVQPFIAGMGLVLFLVHAVYGTPLAYLVGAALGLGLPYVAYRLTPKG